MMCNFFFFLHKNLSVITYKTPFYVTYQYKLTTSILQTNLSGEDSQHYSSCEESYAYPIFVLSTLSNDGVLTIYEARSAANISPLDPVYHKKMYPVQSI